MRFYFKKGALFFFNQISLLFIKIYLLILEIEGGREKKGVRKKGKERKVKERKEH